MLLLCVFLVLAVLKGTTAKLLSVYFQPGVHLKRDSARLLRSTSALQLGGSVDIGYFYTHVELGTPPRNFSVIPDTGSSLTYVPCSGCDSCGTHEDAPFNSTSSSTFHQVECDETACSLACKRSCCTSNNQCRYTISYTEGSSVTGRIVQDHIWLTDTGNPTTPADSIGPLDTKSVPVAFGCDNVESGEIFRQTVDGIAGLADDPLAVTRQLAEAGAISSEFTVCFGHTGGGLFLGSLPKPLLAELPPAAVAPRSRNAHFYNVRINSLKFGDEALNIDLSALERGYGTIVDTGTTFTYLPSQAHGAFVGAFADAAALSGHSLHWDTIGTHCFSSQDLTSHADLAATFPNVTLVFSEAASLPLTPRAYLFQKLHPSAAAGATSWCLGILDGGPDTATIGAVTLRDVVVTFDNGQRELRFRPVHSCSEFAAALSAGSSAAAHGTAEPIGNHSPPVTGAATDQEASTTDPDASHDSTKEQKSSGVLKPAQEQTVGPEPHAQNVALVGNDDGLASNVTNADHGASDNTSSHAFGDESRSAKAPTSLHGSSLQRLYGAGRLALGLLMIAVFGLLLWKWGSRRPATKGYAQLAEAKGHIRKPGSNDVESQGTGHRAQREKAQLLQHSVSWR